MPKKRPTHPIILNYTGKTIIMPIESGDSRFNENIKVLELPALGCATTKTEKFQEDGNFFESVSVMVQGLPEPIHNAVFIVSKKVAYVLSVSRSDLVFPTDAQEDAQSVICRNLAKMYIG